MLLTSEPLARSAGGLTVSLTGRTTWAGTSDRSRRLAGVDMRARVVSPRQAHRWEATSEPSRRRSIASCRSASGVDVTVVFGALYAAEGSAPEALLEVAREFSPRIEVLRARGRSCSI